MRIKPGATFINQDKCHFSVWVPNARKLEIIIEGNMFPMEKTGRGYWEKILGGISPGTRYKYLINGKNERPDPASLSQPHGVHEASEVIDHSAFNWEVQDWKGIAVDELIIYELHVGTFSDTGDFEGVIKKLDYLSELGITAIELMPLASFPGSRNWGYDGVYLYAVQESYGGPEGLKKLVDACHKKNMAVILDVVYNHLGPEGNYLRDFGPYFTSKYHTPWGDAINFDEGHSDEVRNFFIQNTLMWFRDYKIDGLRLDAVHAIMDLSAKHFLKELSEEVQEFNASFNKKHFLIAESDLNDVRIIDPYEKGGYGIDVQWCDDFHHALHALVTGERNGYYKDFGSVSDLAKSYSKGFVYNWKYSNFREKHFGADASRSKASQFVVFSQNHDQVGNRMLGERLSELVSFECLKLIAGAVFVAPYHPLIFMGEEYGETNPFLYFVSHGDENLINAVRRGRKREFKSFAWKGSPPDPQDEDTFLKSKLSWNLTESKREFLLKFYKKLIELKKNNPVLKKRSKVSLEVSVDEELKLLFLARKEGDLEVLAILNFSTEMRHFKNKKKYDPLLNSSDEIWAGPRHNKSIEFPSGIEIFPESIMLLESK